MYPQVAASIAIALVANALVRLVRHHMAADLADAAGTIGYEILTSLGQRYNRRYAGTP